MAHMQLLDCCHPTQGALERVHYFQRQLLTADDLTADQEYFREKLRRHNRYLHGWGTVCGLEVVAAPTGEIPWRVQVTPGYALGPWGDEIYVGEPVHIDLARCGPGAVTDPCEPDLLHTGGSALGPTLFLAIKYAECLAKPVRALPAGCACEEEACEYSRIRDSFQIECLAELPPSHQPKPPDPLLCDLINGKRLPPCPPCPVEPWVVLAQVALPASPSTDITDSSIDNITFRRQIYSTAVLQAQLIACCCREQPQPVASLQVDNVLVLHTLDNSEEIVFNWRETPPEDPSQPIDVADRANLIEIVFTEPIDRDSVNDTTFIVSSSLGVGQPGTLTVSSHVVRWKGNNDFRFRHGQVFIVTLVGDAPDAIKSTHGSRLDGETHEQLPSGDGHEGGNFVFRLRGAAPPIL
jgi:hypothetical protein